MKDKIQKVIDIYEDSYDRFQGVLVFVNCEVCDTDFTSVNFWDDTFWFEFMDDDIKDFHIKVEDIKEIIFDGDDSMKISILKLVNCDTIMIHCF
jgi:hypothetical protein